jgi:hypothetical protein
VQKYSPIGAAQKDENFTELAAAIKSCRRPGLAASENINPVWGEKS